jgi:general secretion pathway protein J
MRHSRNQAGFTLVEMLVALAIFALLAAAGVGLLRSSVDTQGAVERRLYELGSLGRVHALLSSDISQIVNRPTRAGGGTRPAFIGMPDRMEFVRGGWANLDGEKRSDLQRVLWRFDKGGLIRAGFRGLDGAGDGMGAAVAPGAQAAFRYRGADGQWSPAFQPAPDQPLPTAVELTLTPLAQAPVTMIVALPQALPLKQAGGQ